MEISRQVTGPPKQSTSANGHGCPPSPDAWGRLNVVTPFHHLSGDSHLHPSLGAGGPITASSLGQERPGEKAYDRAVPRPQHVRMTGAPTSDFCTPADRRDRPGL